MGIPEDQLTTWAKIGAQVTSKNTYASVKSALEGGAYGNRTYKPFLQGSYGNDTNIRVESDVDVVMELSSLFYYDLSALSDEEKSAFKGSFSAADYNYASFRHDVLEALTAQFGGDVSLGSKAITIEARNNRRKADVLVAFKHRRYLRFPTITDDDCITGITFFKSDGTQVVNYPQLHSTMLANKNGHTSEWFKHLVRVFKNARQSLVDAGTLSVGVAPSYYIEGLIYNVPSARFGKTYADSMFGCLEYLTKADRSAFRCPNGQYPLLDGNPEVTWPSASCTTFMNAIVNLWNNW